MSNIEDEEIEDTIKRASYCKTLADYLAEWEPWKKSYVIPIRCYVIDILDAIMPFQSYDNITLEDLWYMAYCAYLRNMLDTEFCEFLSSITIDDTRNEVEILNASIVALQKTTRFNAAAKADAEEAKAAKKAKKALKLKAKEA